MVNRLEAVAIVERLTRSINPWKYRVLNEYYEGTHRLPTLGLSIPPGLENLEAVINWPRVVVETLTERSEVRSLIDRATDGVNEYANEVFERNALDSQTVMFTRDKLVYGRAFMVVGTDEHNPDGAVVTVESPREMTVEIDPRTRTITSAVKAWANPNNNRQGFNGATLYLPDSTWHFRRESGAWKPTHVDEHHLGRVPVVMCLNRQRTGDWQGTPEIQDIIPVTDMAVRALTGLQFGLETVAIPRKYVIGAAQSDFVDKDGNPTTKWQNYMTEMWSTVNEKAKIGQLAGADLSNYHNTLQMYGKLASSVTGFPAAYFGNFSANPAAEGAIRAEEARLVKTVERSNLEVGKAISWAIDIATRYKTGSWPVGNTVRVEWQDPGTPTYSQRADALQKLAGGIPIISREDAQDELGWTQARKARSRQYFEEQDMSGVTGRMLEKYDTSAEFAEDHVEALPEDTVANSR